MDANYILVMVSAPSELHAQKLADELLGQKLAACVSIIPAVKSKYLWLGEKVEDEEVLLLAKTRAELFESDLVPTIQGIHPYEVPEIVALPIILGSQSYLEWIGEMTGK